MIHLRRVTKTFRTGGLSTTVADAISIDLPSDRAVALLGRNGAGKSSLLRMIAGVLPPDRGRILHRGRVSWPVGFGGGFHRELSAAQNIRFIARIHGVDTGDLIDFVQDFAEIGRHFHQPVRTYSSGMHSRVAFGVSMGVGFDTYLIDEVMAVGDARFKAKCAALLDDRLSRSGAIVVSHSEGQIRRMCRAAMVLERGRLTWFDDVEAGLDRHNRNLAAAA